MRSLFFKIFIWFWFAEVLVVGVQILSDRWMGPMAEHQREGLPMMMEDLASLYGQRAVNAYESGGKLSLMAYLEDLEDSPGFEGYLSQDGQTSLLGDPLPDVIIDRVQEGDMPPSGPDFPIFNPLSPPPPLLVMSEIPGKDEQSYYFVMRIPFGPMHNMLERTTSVIFRSLMIAVMGGLVCYGLARYLTSPLRKLQYAARRLATGDLSCRIGSTLNNRHDEIGDLGRDFDFMVEQIDSLVSGQKRLLRDISHELRSPLTRLNVALELARQRAGEQAKEPLNRIELEVGRINDLIGQLLTLARLETQTGGREKVKIDLSELVNEIAEDAGFEARGVSRSVRIVACENCVVDGSPELLRSALENVVRNAVRYTAENTEVELSLRKVTDQSGAKAVVTVRDHGPGVPVEDLTKIFEPFYRVADSRDRKTGGIGLGLTITQRAVLFHGGMIEAQNEPQGGLTVRIKLPLATANSQNDSGRSVCAQRKNEA
jgi:two-component system sensor histidine kinase CpxA